MASYTLQLGGLEPCWAFQGQGTCCMLGTHPVQPPPPRVV